MRQVVVFALFSSVLCAGESRHIMKTKIGEHQLSWLEQFPEAKPPADGWPLILFLHGYGECGEDLDQVRKHGPPKLAAEIEQLGKCVIISPQCPKNSWWRVKALKSLVQEVTARRKDIDHNRIYVTGLSMGGYGTWSLLSQYPGFFAAAVPICGGGDPLRLLKNRPPVKQGIRNEFLPDGLKRSAKTPIWTFHGIEDTAVPVAESQRLVDLLKAAGSDVRFTVYDGVGHVGAWEKAYTDPVMWTWLFSQSRSKGASPVSRSNPPPTHADVAYGPHKANVLDVWIAEGEGPRPLHVYIHGGGWIGGDKFRKGDPQNTWLSKGISYAAINYRHTPVASLPAPVYDAARAIQYLRHRAEEWNIDPNRICLSGGSAGACTSMWLLCHDDLADPNAEDPVLRQSTRVNGAAVAGGQTSIDPKQIEPWLGPNVLKHKMINMAVGERTIEGALRNYDRYRALYREFSAWNHVSSDDPPLFMTYGGDMTLPSKNAGHGIHHPVYGVRMKERADAAGMECHLLIGNGEVSRSPTYRNGNEFIEAILLKGE